MVNFTFSSFLSMENTSSSSPSNALTIDRIIEKFIPVVGAIFVVVGLGYLLYTSVWVTQPIEIKL